MGRPGARRAYAGIDAAIDAAIAQLGSPRKKSRLPSMTRNQPLGFAVGHGHRRQVRLRLQHDALGLVPERRFLRARGRGTGHLNFPFTLAQFYPCLLLKMVL
jgi:hypothetical protein